MKEWIHAWIDTVLTWLMDLGYWGILLGLMIEIIPSEIVLSFGGYLVAKGEINFWWAVVFGTVGGTIAQIFIYWIGRYGGRPFLEKYGKYLLIRKHHIDVSEAWFNKYGPGVIFTARFIPVVRHAISIPAGIACMPLGRFTLLTALAVIPWSIFFIYLGMTLGENWRQIDEKAAPYVDEIMWGAIAVTVLYIGYKLYKRRKENPAREAGAEGERSTAHQLKFVGSEYRVLHGRHVRSGGAAQEMDHIVIGPNGVFHIDSKHWAGEIRFTEHGVERSGKDAREDPTAQAYRHEFVLKDLLRRHNIAADVVGVICFTHPDARIVGKSPAFATLKPDRLVHFIKTYKPKHTLTESQVKQIAKLIEDNSKPSRRR